MITVIPIIFFDVILFDSFFNKLIYNIKARAYTCTYIYIIQNIFYYRNIFFIFRGDPFKSSTTVIE
jgi:hypothetical protein